VLESEADVLSATRGFMAGFDYSLQLQVGCPGGCLFCYVPNGFRLTPAEMRGGNWGYLVRRKRKAVEKFRRHLLAGHLADRTIYWSGVTDPYATPADLTRQVWEALAGAEAALRPRRIVVQTRFNVARDAALISQYAATTTPLGAGPPVVVSFSLGTDRDDLIRAWEKNTLTFDLRVQAITRLRTHGIPVIVTLSPFGLWNDLRGTLRRLRELAIPYVTLLFLKDREPSANTPPAFLDYIREHPEYHVLLDPDWQEEQLAIVRQVFGVDQVLLGQAGFASLASPHQVPGFGVWQ